MQPEVFRQMRAKLACMWSCSKREGKLRRLSAKSAARNSSLELEESITSDDDDVTMKVRKILVEIMYAVDKYSS